jgi:exodeoxyribonuclease VII small subunit
MLEQDYSKINIAKLSFEEAMELLEQVVRKLENGKLSLDNAISDYEFGNKLKNYCEQKLQESILKVEKIMKNEQDGIVTEKFE